VIVESAGSGLPQLVEEKASGLASENLEHEERSERGSPELDEMPEEDYKRLLAKGDRGLEEDYERVETEQEVLLLPGTEGAQSFGDFCRSLFEGLKRSFADSVNLGFYQHKYQTKDNPMVGSVLTQQAVGVRDLRAREAEKRDAATADGSLPEFQFNSGAATLIRLETAANKCALKKLPEMCFQLMFNHECYTSHEPRTIFCKGLMWLGHVVSRRAQVRSCRAPETEDLSVLELEREREMELAVEPNFPLNDGDAEAIMGVEEEPEVVTGVMATLGADELRFVSTPERSARKDWLHRGSREPLASMGLYHYEMYVYTVNMQASCVPPDCFECYVFADTHPDCARRVQKLRLHEAYKVPRLNGVTMPRFEEDPLRNAMLKSMLFRPAFGGVRANDEVTPYEGFVDHAGDFQHTWLMWYAKQQLLAQRCEFLMDKAEKVFVLEDVDVSVPYLACVEGRSQPSSAEFMAHITVEVASNMELQACARAMRGISGRPKSSEFEDPEHRFASVAGAPGGRDEYEFDGMPSKLAPELGKKVRPEYLLHREEVMQVAFHEELHAAPNMKVYHEMFRETMALEQLSFSNGDGLYDSSCGLPEGSKSFEEIAQAAQTLFKDLKDIDDDKNFDMAPTV